MSWTRNLVKDENGGVLTTEMVVFIAVICIILVVALAGLYRAMGTYFGAWAEFFEGTAS